MVRVKAMSRRGPGVPSPRAPSSGALSRQLRFAGLLLALVVVLAACAPAGAARTPTAKPGAAATPAPKPPANAVVVTHWANGHMTRPTLLPKMAAAFNAANVRLPSGKPIFVDWYTAGSVESVDDVASRLGGVAINAKLPDPTIITPSADHWVVELNRRAGRTVVDLGKTESIATTWIGILTFRDMAECLGWPAREIGYADIVALRSDPRGWAAYPCAKAEWGKRPLVAYTDPRTSSTGRSMLFTLYSIAAGKPPDALTVADVNDPKVVEYVRRFQRSVDHYLSGTLPMNTKIVQGPRYGHFFFTPEDNLIHLYQGREVVKVGTEVITPPPLSRPMVMIYPKEGSTLHNHSAGIVQAPWVSAEQAEAAQRWIDYLHEEPQQRTFMGEGFRPATPLALTDPISARFGVDPAKPTVRINPDRIDGEAAAAIVAQWSEVKKPGIVAFVVDTSGSMQGAKLTQAKTGLIQAIDGFAPNTRVGMVTFADDVGLRVPIEPLAENRFDLAATVEKLQAKGGTALYDAIRVGVQMADTAPGERDAIRGVVVMTDGMANAGRTGLIDLVTLQSRSEVAVKQFRGFEQDSTALDASGATVPKNTLIGTGLAFETQH